MSTTAKTKITLFDVHKAIEALAINQAQIGAALLEIITNSPGDNSELYEKVKSAVDDLLELTEKFVDIPYDA